MWNTNVTFRITAEEKTQILIFISPTYLFNKYALIAFHVQKKFGRNQGDFIPTSRKKCTKKSQKYGN